LYQGGLLIGQLYDADRRPLPQAEVSILAGDYTVATTRTDASGVFRVAGLRGGVHRIATANAVATYRLWAAGTAPPQAAPVLPLVVDGELARGQWSPPRPVSAFVESTREWRTNPFIVGGLVAAAVAIPVAIHNADDPPGS
jgi:hypothetical protein